LKGYPVRYLVVYRRQTI